MPMQVQAMSAREKKYLSQFTEFHSIAAEEERPKWLDSLIETVDSDGAFEDYHGFGSPPMLNLWPRDTTAGFSGFDEFVHKILNSDYFVGVRWHENDEADNRSPANIKERIRQTAKRFAQRDRRFAAELVTTSFSLIEHTPLCHDGLPLYSASHAYGAANVGTSAGLSTTEEFAAMFWNFVQYLRGLTDQAGEYLLPEDFISNERLNLLALLPPSLERLAYSAFNREFDARGGVLVAVDNEIPKRFKNTPLAVSSLLSGSTVRLFVTGQNDRKPFLKQNRQPVRVKEFNRDTDPQAALTKMHAMLWDDRVGIGYKDWRFTKSYAA